MGPLIPEMQIIFQEGDLILYDLKGPNKDFLPSKLTTPYKGPYVVLSQYKNDITCRHANVGTVQVFHVDRVKVCPLDTTTPSSPPHGSPVQQASCDYQSGTHLNSASCSHESAMAFL